MRYRGLDADGVSQIELICGRSFNSDSLFKVQIQMVLLKMGVVFYVYGNETDFHLCLNSNKLGCLPRNQHRWSTSLQLSSFAATINISLGTLDVQRFPSTSLARPFKSFSPFAPSAACAR